MLFGTDGVRGKAGRISARPRDRRAPRRARSSAPWAGRRRRTRPLRFHRRARHARVRRLDRARARARRPLGGRGDHDRRRDPDAGDCLCDARDGLRRRLVISASHNPFEDNGIKVFSGRGEKFTEALEREVEAIVADSSWRSPAACDRAGARTPTSSTRTSRTRGRRCRIPSGSAVQARDRHGQRRDDDRRAEAVPRAWVRRRA